MSLTQIKLKLIDNLEKLGHKNGTAPLESTDNRNAEAHEFFIADAIRSYAEKRYKNAKSQAEKAGLLFDDKPIPGSTVNTYENENFVIAAKVASPRSQIDSAALRTALIKVVGEDTADNIIKAATKETKPPVSYIFVER